MAKGNRPSHRLVAVSKDKGADGRRTYTDVGAAWPSEQKAGSWGVKLEKGMKLKTAEGVVLDGDSCFWNFEPCRPFKDEPEEQPDPTEDDDGGF